MKGAIVVLRRLSVLIVLCVVLAACKSDEERVAEHLASAEKLMEQGDEDRAMVEFRNALKVQPANVTALRHVAELHLKRNGKRRAYRNYLAVVEKEPNDLRGRIVLSNIAFETGSWDEFVRHGEKAVELAPEDVEVQAINLGLRYRTAVLDEDETARYAVLDETENLSETIPGNRILRRIRLNGYLARQDYEKALVLVDQNIEEDPKNLELRSGKVELLARIGDEVALERELRAMVEQFPKKSEPKRTLLRYLMSRDRVAEAETFMRALVAGSPEEERSSVYNELIHFLLQTKGTEAALQELEAGIADNPDSGVLRALRASINFDDGRQDIAIAEMEDILVTELTELTVAERQNVMIALARMLLTQGNEVGARKLVEETLASDPNAVEALKMQARWLTEEDDTDAAITVLRMALDQAPQDPEALTLMAQAYQRAGNPDLMRNFLSLAVEASNNAPEYALRFANALLQDDKPLQAEAALISALRLSPRDPETLSALGMIYLQLDDLARARQAVDVLSKIDNPMARQQANFLELEILRRDAGFSEALDFLRGLAAQEGQEGVAAKLALIQVQLRNGQTEAALAYSKELVAEDPDNLQYRNALALTHAAAQDYETAQTELESILEDHPELQGIWLQLARVQAASGNDVAARITIDRGLEALPDNPDLLWGKASYLQADGDIEGAIAIYEGLYERFSSSQVIANNLASLLTTYQDDNESLERSYVIARRLRGTDIPAFQDTYGWILYRRGEIEEAIEYLEPAAAALARDPAVIFHLGMAYAAAGRHDEAVAQLRKAIEVAGPLGADMSPIQQARTKLAELEAANTQVEN